MAKNSFSAGHLRESVAWDKRTATSDGYGNEVGSFSEQFRSRAGFTFLRGSETVMASRLEGRQPMVARVRRSSETEAIRTDWQMRDLSSGLSYAVRSVSPTEHHGFLDVLVEGGVAA